MSRSRLHLRLHPLSADGASTWMSISGPLPTSAGRSALGVLIESLATCTGQPMRVVLSAADRVGWAEAWLRELSRVPELHREIRFRARRRGRGAVAREQLDLFRGGR